VAKKKTAQFTDSDFVVKAVEPTEPQAEREVALSPALGSGFVIEDVAIPKRSGRKPSNIYPINQLEAGSEQSFLVPSSPEEIQKITTRIRTFAYRNDFNVILRTEENGVRVWRKK